MISDFATEMLRLNDITDETQETFFEDIKNESYANTLYSLTVCKERPVLLLTPLKKQLEEKHPIINISRKLTSAEQKLLKHTE